MANWQQIGNLDCIVSQGQDSKRCIVLFHGYGADANDLAPLSTYLDPQQEFTWVFPQGIKEVPLGPGFIGRAWFDIDMASLEQAMMTGTHRQMTDLRPPGMDEAVRLALELLQNCQSQYNEVILGGFSQGAMLATETTFKAQTKPFALIILSGILLDKGNWKNWSPSCEGLKYFQSHGSNDALLDPKQAQQLNQIFKESGLQGQLHMFSGGHEIPPNILQKLKTFIHEP